MAANMIKDSAHPGKRRDGTARHMSITNPDTMALEERLNEVAAILATGVIRVLKLSKTEKIPLDNLPKTRPYVRKTHRNGERT